MATKIDSGNKPITRNDLYKGAIFILSVIIVESFVVFLFGDAPKNYFFGAVLGIVMSLFFSLLCWVFYGDIE